MINKEDQEYIAAKIYSHYSRPSGIHNEKLKIYEKWNIGGFCRARYSFMHNETVYSYFLTEKDGMISVYVNNKEPDFVFQCVKINQNEVGKKAKAAPPKAKAAPPKAKKTK